MALFKPIQSKADTVQANKLTRNTASFTKGLDPS